jgi:hypothetical protein
MPTKKWYQSKTVWLGIIAVAVAALEVIDSGGTYLAAVLAAFGVASVVLRGYTDRPLIK